MRNMVFGEQLVSLENDTRVGTRARGSKGYVGVDWRWMNGSLGGESVDTIGGATYGMINFVGGSSMAGVTSPLCYLDCSGRWQDMLHILGRARSCRRGKIKYKGAISYSFLCMQLSSSSELATCNKSTLLLPLKSNSIKNMDDSRVSISIYRTGSDGGEKWITGFFTAGKTPSFLHWWILDRKCGYRWIYDCYDQQWLHEIRSLGRANA